jgi:anti-anti-sigma factor
MARAGRAGVVRGQPRVFDILTEAGTPSSVPEPVVIAPEGELDLHSVAALTPQLDEAVAAEYPHLILDLSAVTLVDSTALGAIAQVQHRFNGRGRRLSVVAPPGSAAAVLLELSGLRSRFSLFGSRDAASG